ncbi:MAG: HEAT repeat domain-containing protein [Capnocytophaga sp.]|nr:HEAT repeat domain-containing protein [Capnocytophaga sp.]
MKTFDYLITMYYEMLTYPPVIQMAISAILLCLAAVFFMLLYLYSIRRYMERRDALRARIIPKIKVLFYDILYGEPPYANERILSAYEAIVGKLNKSKQRLAIQVLLDIKLRETEKSLRYEHIVKAIGIDEYLGRCFEFSSDATKMKAIQRLHLLELESLDAKILPFTYSKNKRLMREARFSHMQLSSSDPYRFLDETKEPLSKWDEINLLKIFTNEKEQGNLPKFSKWIKYSENTSLTLFLIKAAAYFGQQEAVPVLEKKLKDRKSEVRSEAARSLGLLKAVAHEAALIEMFDREPENCQLAIIEAVGAMNTGNAVGFLKNAYRNAHSIVLKKKIAHVIFRYQFAGCNVLKELKLLKNELDVKIIDHIEASLIKFK